MAGEHPKFKVEPTRVPSDDCPLYVGREYGEVVVNGEVTRGVTNEGTTYYPHTGESVWLLPINDMATYFAVVRMNDATEYAERERSYIQTCEGLARRIARWDWTDLAGQPLPQPYGRPEVIAALDSVEVGYLVDLVGNGPAADQKNGSAPSPTTSSAGRQPKKRS